MKIISNKEYYRLKGYDGVDIVSADDVFAVQQENKDMELKIETIRDRLIDIHNEINEQISKQKIKQKISSLINFIERGNN